MRNCQKIAIVSLLKVVFFLLPHEMSGHYRSFFICVFGSFLCGSLFYDVLLQYVFPLFTTCLLQSTPLICGHTHRTKKTCRLCLEL